MDNVRTVLVDMPVGVRGYTICADDYYTIILNSKLSYMQRCKAYQHEMDHITKDDFAKKTSADLIELYAHKEDT